jgi:hypothetical protein
LIADGKWDAAFHFLKNPEVGFDMEGSPLGDDLFDHYAPPALTTCYKNVYTGFIFYRPIEDWAPVVGIPNIVTVDFHEELMRRLRIESIDGDLDVMYYNNKRTIDIIDKSDLIQNFKKWKVNN